MDKNFKKNSSRKVTDSIRNKSEKSDIGKSSISPANINLKKKLNKFTHGHKTVPATAKHAARKLNSNGNKIHFGSLSPVNKNASPLLKNLTIDVDTPKNT